MKKKYTFDERKTILIYTNVELKFERWVERDDSNCSSSCKICANCSSLLVSWHVDTGSISL